MLCYVSCKASGEQWASTLSFWRVKRHMRIFEGVGVSSPTPCIAQGSTVHIYPVPASKSRDSSNSQGSYGFDQLSSLCIEFVFPPSWVPLLATSQASVGHLPCLTLFLFFSSREDIKNTKPSWHRHRPIRRETS